MFFDPQFKVARSRSRIYLLLSAFFCHPTEHPHVELALSVLASSFNGLPERFFSRRASRADFDRFTSEISRIRKEESIESLSAQYHQLLSRNGLAPPYESCYRDSNSADRNISLIQQVYARSKFSVMTCPDESPDNIVTQLDFLHCLSEVESDCVMEEKPDAAAESRRRQASFLWQHVRTWLPVFCEAVSETPTSDFYRLLSITADSFTRLDAGYLLTMTKADPGCEASSRENGRLVSLTVDTAACSLCGACCEVCKNEALVIEPGETLRLRYFKHRCNFCGDCGQLCPENAISLASACDPACMADSVLISREIGLCPRCRKPNALAPVTGKVIERLGTEVPQSLGQRLLLCPRCRAVEFGRAAK
ncbi:molecular chaperone TorD family protein [Candidatus Poribacteria bacterium]|nr:molecular chaperone TorD family protein [Candidatus Poribacteria bacterium]